MKVLLADANQDRADSVADRLGAAGVAEIVRLAPGQTLAAAVAAHQPDVVIVDMARPDRDSLEGIRQVAAEAPRPIVLFVDLDDTAFMEQAIEAGVSSYNVVGAALPEIKPIVQAAVAMFRRYRQIEDDLHKAEASLRERALIDRAKAHLMRERRISEPEAYRWLRRQAMDRGRRIADIAAELMNAQPRPDAGTAQGDRDERG